MASNSRREFIDHIRREKFGIGTTKSNPLAGMLHEAIVHLSAELYQKDIHFVSELLQNAEDNVYGNGVSPSLELVLTEDDIAKVGAQATLILFNNEVGFQSAHVEALCAVGLSTKKGKRDSGYIGEKGIGFKSVFLVTRTPYIISNGYRFRFKDEASKEAKIGYVVPEWADVPTDADLRRVYGKQKLPQTMIILPLRPDKIKPVREQLKQVSPETLLFLTKLRQIVVREKSQNSLCITRSDISGPWKEDERCKVATVNLSVGSNATHVSEECNYQLVQQQLPVTHRVEQRKEVENWDITIAFPLHERINPGRFSGDIYAFLPSYLPTGFPFVINADFLLVSSRETLKFDSPWNIGILSCVPGVFLSAFKLFLQKFNTSSQVQLTGPAVAVQEAYRYIPVEKPQNMELRKVQERVLDLLKDEDCVLVDSPTGHTRTPSTLSSANMFCKPAMARLIRPEFRSILVAANAERNPNPAVRNLQWYVVDCKVQESYTATLESLGVRHMTEGDYMECLQQEDWLLSLSEQLYCEVVCFAFDYCKSSRGYGQMEKLPILKYAKDDGSIVLASVQELKTDNGLKIYLSPSRKGEWLSTWTSVFKPWVSALFMPAETVRVLKELKEKSSPKVCRVWPFLVSLVPDMSVRSYVSKLLSQLSAAKDPEFVILATEFAYQCTQEKDLEIKDVSAYYPGTNVPIVNQSGSITWISRHSNMRILLPAHGSLWPKLCLNSWSNQVFVMSDDYVKTPSTWPSNLKAFLSAKESLYLESYRSYLRSVVGAWDIPHVIPPDGASYQMPTQLSSNMTIEKAVLLLQWLTTCSRYLGATSTFLQTLKETQWLPTKGHGRRRPSSCFEGSSFSTFLMSNDLPWVDPSLIAFRSTLADLGVITDIQKGCNAVANYMLEMSDDSEQMSICDLQQATRLYTYLQKFLWTPVANSKKLKIFVPPGSASNSPKAWQENECCVLHKVDGFFDESLIVLDCFYPKSLLPFFAKVLKVPHQATVERYCQLWLNWRSDVHEITVDECTRVWKILSEKWEICEMKVRKEFIAQAWAPSKSSVTGAFQLSSPRVCFIPDHLDLVSLFSAVPNVQFVWYPDNSQKMECVLNKVYVEMGVKKLSDCVRAEFIDTDRTYGACITKKCRVDYGNKILCSGLFRAILGFIARKRYGLSCFERQTLLVSLQGVAQLTISKPLSRSYRISCLSPPAIVTQDNVMAHWSTTEGKFYCLDNDNPVLQNPLTKRDFRVQVATTISHGLLSQYPQIADDLTEFMIGLLDCGFESSHVEYELKRKNGKLYEEDENFLSQSQM